MLPVVLATLACHIVFHWCFVQLSTLTVEINARKALAVHVKYIT